MFNNYRQLKLALGVALVLVLGIYSIAQGYGLPILSASPAPQSNAPEASAQAEIPSGAVMFFDLPGCPDGWTELTDAQGRYVVGLPGGGTGGATVGTALYDQENRPVGQHAHDVDDAGHGHTVNDLGHSHIATDQGHSHGINDPGHAHTYKHTVNSGDSYGEDSHNQEETTSWTSTQQTGITILTAHADIVVDTSYTGLSLLNNTTGVTVEDAGTVAGTNAPYIQLLVCRKD